MAMFSTALRRSLARHSVAEARILGLHAAQRSLVTRSLASSGALRPSSPRLARKAPSARAPSAAKAAPSATAVEEDWTEVKDASGQVYWWNQRTNETTAVGAPKPGPDAWQEVKDAHGQVYWWNKETNATTAVGAPKPSYNAGSGVAAHGQQAVGQPAQQPGMMGGLGGAMAEGMAWGVGTSVASRMVDGVMGPRSMEVVHRNEGGDAAGAAGGMAPPPPGMDAGGSMAGGGEDIASQGWSWGEGDQGASDAPAGDEGGGLGDMIGGLGDWFGGGDGW